MAQVAYQTETTVLHGVATDPQCRWRWTRHALEQMAKRGITAPDVQEALTNGYVEIVERKQEDVWRVKGVDLDGNPLTVPCVVDQGAIWIKVVTAF